jgi:hypothetical protein
MTGKGLLIEGNSAWQSQQQKMENLPLTKPGVVVLK